jgi:hypothetical protein
MKLNLIKLLIKILSTNVSEMYCLQTGLFDSQHFIYNDFIHNLYHISQLIISTLPVNESYKHAVLKVVIFSTLLELISLLV